jgi:hypothetical protein
VTDDPEYAEFAGKRRARTRVVAWVVIIAMVLVGGGATVLSLLFG